MALPPYQKAVTLMLVSVGSFALVAIAAFAVDQPPLAFLGVIPATLIGLLALGVRCARCGKPVFGRPVRVADYEVYNWSDWPWKKCRACGAVLTTF